MHKYSVDIDADYQKRHRIRHNRAAITEAKEARDRAQALRDAAWAARRAQLRPVSPFAIGDIVAQRKADELKAIEAEWRTRTRVDRRPSSGPRTDPAPTPGP
jgi:hypothetical protein